LQDETTPRLDRRRASARSTLARYALRVEFDIEVVDAYHFEHIWDVSSLDLPPGTYSAEFLIYDGDRDRGIGCVDIVITQMSDERSRPARADRETKGDFRLGCDT
jgi:hypothetical protein